MITTSVYIGTSLDGFIAKKDGNIDWLVKFESAEIGDSYMQFIGNIDVHVIGRGTYEKVLTFEPWPYEKKVFVLSNSIKVLPVHLKHKVEIISMSPLEVIKHLLSLGFSRIYIDGGEVIQKFLLEDCVDELIITRIPLLLGNGLPLFGLLNQPLSLKHEGTQVFQNGLVRSHYKRERN